MADWGLRAATSPYACGLMSEMCRHCRSLLPPKEKRLRTDGLCRECARALGMAPVEPQRPSGPPPAVVVEAPVAEPAPRVRPREAVPVAPSLADPIEEPPSVVVSPRPAPPAATAPIEAGDEAKASPPTAAPAFELVRTCNDCGTQFPADRNRCPKCRLNFKLGAHPDEEDGRAMSRDPRVHLVQLLIMHPRGGAIVCGFIALLWVLYGSAETQAVPILLMVAAVGLVTWGALREQLARNKAGLRSRRRARRAKREKRRQARAARKEGRTQD